MTINLIDCIKNNRTNTKAVPMDCYGPNGKTLWAAFNTALYDWSISESDDDRSKAFEAGRGILATINAELDDGRKVKFSGVEDLLRYRDAAVRFVNRDNDDTATLKAMLSFALYRAGESDKFSCTESEYKAACKLAKVAPTKGYAMDTKVAKALATKLEAMLKERKDAKEAKQKVKAPVAVEAFRKSCEVLIAEKLDSVLAMTTEQIAAARKAKNAARRDARNTAKKAAEKAAKKAA